MIVGATELTPTAEKIRRLMHFGQTLQSHALHFFHLCSPDLLFGFDDDVRHRNIIGVIEDHPEIATQGVNGFPDQNKCQYTKKGREEFHPEYSVSQNVRLLYNCSYLGVQLCTDRVSYR